MPQSSPIKLTDAEIERKFAECGMASVLQKCKATRTDRDPNVLSNPPNTSVVHKREHGLRYCDETGEFVALIFYWEGPDGTDRRSIREFVADGVLYRLKLRSFND